MKQEYGEVTIPSHSYKCLVQDSKRLQFLVEERCVVATTKIWEVDHYRLEWPFEGYYQREWYKTAEEAIDAQMEGEHP